MRLIPSLTTLSLLSRTGTFISTIITVGLNAKFLTNTSWANDLLVYIVVIASFSALACFIPPYPNFLCDTFWALASALCQGFALVIQFTDSPCYGFRANNENEVRCATYKAGTAFAFLMAMGWGTSALLGLLRILGVVFNIGQNTKPLPLKRETPNEKEAFGKTRNEDTGQSCEIIKERKRIDGFGNDHIARYFSCYGILGVALLAILLPILIIYAAPAFATYLLNESPLPLLQVSLLSPTNDSIRFSASSEIKVPDAMTMHLDSMHAVILRPQSNEKTKDDPIPLATVDLSKLKFKGNQRFNVENQTLKLRDVGQFAKLVEDVAYNPAVRVAMHANTMIGISGLRMRIGITKEMEMSGFNNFSEIAISNLTISERDGQGNNIFAEAVVSNPTPASVTLGEVTLSILAANHSIGTATTSIHNITPGNNTLVIRASLDGKELEENISEIIREQIPYLRNESFKITVAGKSVVYEDQHLEYWEEALQNVSVEVIRSVREMVDMVLEALGSEENGGGGVGGSGFDLFGIGIDIPGARDGVRAVVERLLEQILDTAQGLDEDDEDRFTEGLAALGRLLLRLLEALGVL